MAETKVPVPKPIEKPSAPLAVAPAVEPPKAPAAPVFQASDIQNLKDRVSALEAKMAHVQTVVKAPEDLKGYPGSVKGPDGNIQLNVKR